MIITPVTHEKQVKGWHVTCLDMTPAAAAMHVEQKFKRPVTTVYTLGRRCFIPVDIEPEQFWLAVDNGC